MVKRRVTGTLAIGLAVLMIQAGGAARAQERSPAQAPTDPQVQEVRKAIEEAQKEISAFRDGGGKNDAPDHPAVKWFDRLWEYRSKYPSSDAAGLATFEALHFLFHADRADQVLSRMDALPPDDTAWERLPNVLNEIANQRKDQAVLNGRLERIAERTTSPRIRAAALLGLGRSLWSTDSDRARSLLERALADAPGTPTAREADNLLYEIASLSVGKPAPAFSAKAWKGDAVALDGYKNQALVIVFWAST